MRGATMLVRWASGSSPLQTAAAESSSAIRPVRMSTGTTRCSHWATGWRDQRFQPGWVWRSRAPERMTRISPTSVGT